MRAPEESAGKKARCPKCSTLVNIPVAGHGVEDPLGRSAQDPLGVGSAPAKGVPGAAAASNPYSVSPGMAHSKPAPNPAGSAYGGQYVKNHRGSGVLALGIVSLVFALSSVFTFCCGLFLILPVISITVGIIGWIMGSADLKAMRTGRMDRSGEGQTKAGWILSIIGTCMSAFFLIIFVGMIVFFLVFQVAAVGA